MTAAVPKPIATDRDTVTFSRSDWEAFLERLEDAEDEAVIAAEAAKRERLGAEEYSRLCYTWPESRRMLEGTPALTIWRERAGLSQKALAAQAGVSQSYLNEIESGKKPGSAVALRSLAKALHVPMELLVED